MSTGAARSSGVYVPGASNPGRMREDVGGGAFNALRNAVQRGIEASLMSVRGADSAGDNVARAIHEAKIRDLSAVFLDRATPSYTALIDRDGDVLAGLADMELYEIVFAKQLRRSKARDEVAGADAILCDANLPAAALERLAALAGGQAAVRHRDLAGQGGAARGRARQRLLPVHEPAARRRLFPAAPEDAAPASVANGLRAAGLSAGVITAGSAAVTGFDAGRHLLDRAPGPAVDGRRDRRRRRAGRRDGRSA